MKRYLVNILISIDQLANTLLAGDPDETISSRMGKWQQATGIKKAVSTPIAWFLDKIDRNHCKDAIELDEGSDDLL